MTSVEVLKFWFEELTPAQWFKKDVTLDEEIRNRFLTTHQMANRCELSSWRENAHGRLAEILVLDQFSRNIFRGTGAAFASDPLALALAQEAVRFQSDLELQPHERPFLYMPYMHSESASIHEVAVELFDQPGLESNYDFELRHKAIIDRFGRFPHRNAALGRASTPQEIEFLKKPGSGF